MPKHSTKPVEISGIPLSEETVWQPQWNPWSFSSAQGRLFADLPSDPRRCNGNGAANRDEIETLFSKQRIDVPKIGPVAAPIRDFGRASFMPVYQWEGVVERVTEEGFRARLLPIVRGKPRGSPEFTDFSLGDLATDEDHALVEEGAIFYWTLGKERSPAGTVRNVSLVRFRRLPPSAPQVEQEARREAEALLKVIVKDEPSS
jgi:hypothetical protein